MSERAYRLSPVLSATREEWLAGLLGTYHDLLAGEGASFNSAEAMAVA